MSPRTSRTAKRPPPKVQVPRDRKVDRGRSPSTPSPDGQTTQDEDYTDREKPLVAGSAEAKRLHERPPKGKGQLRVGTGGDAGRPGKSGIYGKPLPRRGRV